MRTTFASGFRAPQVFDEDLHITLVGGEGQIIQNADDLQPERAYSASQQLESRFELGEDWNLKLGINGYYTLITKAHVIEQADDPATPDELEFERRNRGETTVVGAEFDLQVQYLDVFGVAGGTTSERAQNSEPDGDFNSRKIFRTPSLYGYVEIYGYPTKDLRISTTANLTGSMDVPHYAGYVPEDRLDESDPFLDWGANVSYRVNLRDSMYVRPYAGIRNILDSYQDDFDQGPDRDAGYVYGPRLPRTLLFGVQGGIQ
jgi:outer membrane receptor for ferrienterochelin and colicins